MSIYVVSNQDLLNNNKLKLGKTTQSSKKLLTIYQRYLDCAEIILWYPSKNHHKDENKLLRKYDKFRGITPNGNKNEWLNIDVYKIKIDLDNYFYKKRKKKNTILNLSFCSDDDSDYVPDEHDDID